MRVLVTGGAGFIGSQVAQAYLERGAAVTIVDSLATGKRERVPPGAEFHQLDICAPELAALVPRGRFDLINHHAAQVSVNQSVAQPSLDAAVNVLGSLHVLEAAIAAGVPRVVLASSSAVYGAPAPSELPIKENAPIHPLSPYGAAKRSIELYAEVLSGLHGMSVTCLRYANVYGPGAEPHTEAGVIPLFIAALRAGQTPTIYGDGTATRDYLYIADVARGNLLAAECLQGFHILNFGTGRQTSVSELCALLRARLGGLAPVHLPARPGDIEHSALDASRAAELLGWRAEVALADGLDRTLS
jgi:UDP-glucose 4-epimerase